MPQEFTEFQLSLSTADEEEALFDEVESAERRMPEPHWLPAGIYRIIDGQLYRIVPGTPEPG